MALRYDASGWLPFFTHDWRGNVLPVTSVGFGTSRRPLVCTKAAEPLTFAVGRPHLCSGIVGGGVLARVSGIRGDEHLKPTPPALEPFFTHDVGPKLRCDVIERKRKALERRYFSFFGGLSLVWKEIQTATTNRRENGAEKNVEDEKKKLSLLLDKNKDPQESH